MRICSLLPGATEVVAALGLADDLVGISHECDYPAAIHAKPVLIRADFDSERMSSPDIDRRVRTALATHQPLYILDEVRFRRAQPDLIITQDLCHVCAVTPGDLQQAIRTLPRMPEILTLNPTCLEDVLTDIDRIGEAAGRPDEARALSSTLRDRLQSIREQVSPSHRPKVACLEWLDPLFTAGHWIPEMVTCAGGQDMLGMTGTPSEQTTWESLTVAAPDVVIVMPCGFSIERSLSELDRVTSHPSWAGLPAVRNGQAFVVDATSSFSRPGPRLVDGVALLAALFNPALHDVPSGACRITS